MPLKNPGLVLDLFYSFRVWPYWSIFICWDGWDGWDDRNEWGLDNQNDIYIYIYT